MTYFVGMFQLASDEFDNIALGKKGIQIFP